MPKAWRCARHPQHEDITIRDPDRAKPADLPKQLTNRLKFRLERLVLRGPQYRLLLIAALIGLISVAAGTIIHYFDPNFRGGFPQAVWWSFLRLSDPGYLGDDTGGLERTVSTVLTVLGYVVFLGALVAILTQWLNERMSELEAGLTPIAQRDHVLLIGWTNRTAMIVRELVLSEGRVRRFLRRHGARRLRIAILADAVTEKLRLELRGRLGKLWNERQIVLRTGTALREDNLRRVDFMRAAAVILPAADFTRAGAAHADTRAIKTLLSMSNHPSSGDGSALPLAVAEILDERKIDVARRAYRGPIEILASDSIISRLITQNVRQPGLSHVYSELLTHGRGNEIYIRETKDLVGLSFGDIVNGFPQAIPLGIVRAEGNSFMPLLNPAYDLRIEPDDRLVILARNFDAIARAMDRTATASHVTPVVAMAPQAAADTPGSCAENPRRVLVLGWSHRSPALLHEFSSYRNEFAHIDIVSSTSIAERTTTLRDTGFEAGSITYTHIEADFTMPLVLERLRPADYHSIVLLGTDRLASDEESDARSIVGYLLLREVLGEEHDPAVIIELLDAGNVTLFRERRAEVLISPMILSHMLAQVALRREMRAVFDELFGPDGAEIVFRTAADLGLPADGLPFRAIAAAAAARGEIALGVKTGATDLRAAGGLRMNPTRDRVFELTPDDRVIILR